MPLTSAERQQRRRQKLKDEGRYEDYRKNQNLFAKKNRDKIKETEQNLSKSAQKKVLKERREDVRRRVAKCRALKKEKINVDQEDDHQSRVFESGSSLDKTTTRIKHALRNLLPSNSKKKQAMLLQLFHSEVEESPVKNRGSKPGKCPKL